MRVILPVGCLLEELEENNQWASQLTLLTGKLVVKLAACYVAVNDAVCIS